MIISYVIKRIKRSVLHTVLFILIIALAGALLNLGSGILASTLLSMENTSKVFTTIAIPDSLAIKAYAEQNPVTEINGFVLPNPSIMLAENNIKNELMSNKILSEYAKLDTRDNFSAYVKDINALTTKSRAKTNTSIEMDYPYNIAAFVVKCNEVNISYENYGGQTLVGDEYINTAQSYTTAKAVIEEVIYIHPSYKLVDEIEIGTGYLNFDGSAVMKQGSRYLVVGQYNPPSCEFSDFVPNIGLTDSYINTYGVTDISFEGAPVTCELPSTEYDGFYSWFELSGTLEEALASDKGDQIRTALSIAEKSLYSVGVLTTDNFNSILQFNQNTAKIIDGRSFNTDEGTLGKKVCVISAGLAEFNDLKVGDSLPLQFYKSDYHETRPTRGLGFWTLDIYRPGMLELPEENYEIVGIYQMPEWELGPYSLTPNTVIIPSSSFAGFPAEEENEFKLQKSVPPFCFSYIIENGKINEFKADVEKAFPGYGAIFMYFDQGYSGISGTLDNLFNSSTLIFAICAAAWLAVVVLFILLCLGNRGYELGILSSVGIGRGFRRKSLFLYAAVIIVSGGAIGFSASTVLYEKVIDYSYSAARSKEVSNSDFSDEAIISEGYKHLDYIEDENSGISNADRYEINMNVKIVVAVSVVQTVLILCIAATYSNALTKKNPLTLLRAKGR